MKEINYTQRDEHFSSNMHYYDKKEQAKIARKELKTNLLLWFGDFLDIAGCFAMGIIYVITGGMILLGLGIILTAMFMVSYILGIIAIVAILAAIVLILRTCFF